MTRPRSFASCKFKTDRCFGLPEVVSYNIYPQWYHDTPAGEYLADLYGWVQAATEGGGQALSGHGDRRGRAVRVPQPLCRQMERGAAGENSGRTAFGGAALSGLRGGVCLAALRHPRQRRVVGRPAPHDEQQGDRGRIPPSQIVLRGREEAVHRRPRAEGTKKVTSAAEKRRRKKARAAAQAKQKGFPCGRPFLRPGESPGFPFFIGRAGTPAEW